MTDEEKTHEEKTSRSRKQKRRGKGEGSIYPDKKNDRWVGSFFTEEGKRRYVYGKTQEEAREKLRTVQYADKQGTLATGPQQTVQQFMEYWLEEVHKPTIRISSYIRYRGILDNHILPALGHIRVQKLTVQHVESFYTLLAKEGSSARSIKVVHAVLHRALAHAVYLNLVSRNVCDIAKKSLPQHTRYEIHTLTKEQAQRLLQQVRGHEQFEALLTLAITTGMRRGELVALRWSDIHFEESFLEVRRSARRAGRTGYGLQITEPKTASGRRKIVLSAFLLDVLKRHHAGQEERRQATGGAWVANDLVFCGQHGEYLNPNRPSLWLKRLLKDAGIEPMRFHDLRHSAATLLLTMGVHVKVVQELLGHSTILMTLDVYAHVLPSLQQDAMDKLSGLFDYDNNGDRSGDNPGNVAGNDVKTD